MIILKGKKNKPVVSVDQSTGDLVLVQESRIFNEDKRSLIGMRLQILEEAEMLAKQSLSIKKHVMELKEKADAIDEIIKKEGGE